MLFRTLLLAVILVCPLAHGAEVEPGQDEYDFSWLDPEKKIYVVQNRKYTKKNRVELALSGGVGMGEPFRSSYTVIPRAFFYFNESWGISGFMGFNSNSENDDFLNFKTNNSTLPVIRDIQSFVGGSVVWVPFYGKINMFNQIFYLDWHLEAGAGQVSSEIDLNRTRDAAPRIEESTHTSFHWGTGQKFFITRNFAIRLDYLSIYYKAPLGADGSLTSQAGSVEDSNNNHFVSLGASYTF